MLCHFLLLSMVFDEKSIVMRIVFHLQVRCHFSLTAFKICCLFFFFICLTICLAVDFFEFILFGFFQNLWSVVLWMVFFPNIEHFQPLSFEYFYSPTISLLLQDSSDENVSYFVIVPQVPYVFIIFEVLYLCSSGWVTSFVLLQVHQFIPPSLHLLLSFHFLKL